MELWKVTLTYRDVAGEKEWNRAVEKMHGSRMPPPMPDRKRAVTYVAVHGGFGANQIAEAGELAIASVVGDVMKDATKIQTWQPIVEAAEWVHTVAVAREEAP